MAENIEFTPAISGSPTLANGGSQWNGNGRSVLRFVPPALKHIAKSLIDTEYRHRGHEIVRLRKLPRYQQAVTTLLGKPFRILDAASFLFMEREIFQQKIYAFHARSDTPRIIDGGANIGLSVLFFNQLYPNCSITAFEPDPEIFDVLEENVRVHGGTNVKLIPCALWSSKTALQFHAEGADGGRISRSKDSGECLVETERLQDFLNEPIDFLKLDIEGAETVVLEDCRNNLGKVSNIFVEYHSFVSERQSLPRLLKILDDAGFRIHMHPSSQSPQPFLGRHAQLGMDLQLNIFGFRA